MAKPGSAAPAEGGRLPLADRLALLTLLLYLAVLPVWPAGCCSAHDLSRFAQLPVFITAAWAVGLRAAATAHGPHGLTGLLHQLRHITRWLRADKPRSSRWLLLALGLLMVLASAARAARPAMAWLELSWLAGLWLVLLLVRQVARQATSQRWLMQGLVAGAALYAAQFLVLLGLALATAVPLDGWTLVFGYDNPRFFNHVQTLSLPVLAAVAASTRWPGRWRALAMATLLVNVLLLIATFGRGTMLSVLVAMALVCWRLPAAGRRLAVAGVLATIGGAVLHQLLFRYLPAWLGVASQGWSPSLASAGGDSGRFYLWRIALEHIAQAPWLGIGPMHFALVPNDKGAHPHNMWLLLAAECGLPVAAGAAVLVLWALWRALQALRRQARAGAPDQAVWAAGAWCAAAGASVDALFSGNLVMPVSQLWVVVAAGLLWALASPAGVPAGAVSDSPPPHSWPGQVVAALVLSLPFLLQAPGLWRSWWSTVGAASGPALPSGQDKLRPRFWVQGWIAGLPTAPPDAPPTAPSDGGRRP